MIENANNSKVARSGEFVDIKKYIGVASIHVLALNPNNDKLRKYGWSVPEDADEPKYVTVDKDGNKSARVRFLVQIQDLEEKPIVAMDFWVRPEAVKTQSGKYKIIDAYGRTAYGTYDEVSAHKIPQYSNGPAQIAPNYKPCHSGEEELVSFLMKYLNITPFQTYNRSKGEWVPSKNPGRLTIDNWNALCDGIVAEIAEYIALQPENCVKVALGVRTTDDNKSYQTFLNTNFFGNASIPDKGEYTNASRAIDRYMTNHPNAANTTTFSAKPVQEWSQTASEVMDNSEMEVIPGLYESMDQEKGDLPF